jgi:hypothetical protein
MLSRTCSRAACPSCAPCAASAPRPSCMPCGVVGPPGERGGEPRGGVGRGPGRMPGAEPGTTVSRSGSLGGIDGNVAYRRSASRITSCTFCRGSSARATPLANSATARITGLQLMVSLLVWPDPKPSSMHSGFQWPAIRRRLRDHSSSTLDRCQSCPVRERVCWSSKKMSKARAHLKNRASALADPVIVYRAVQTIVRIRTARLVVAAVARFDLARFSSAFAGQRACFQRSQRGGTRRALAPIRLPLRFPRPARTRATHERPCLDELFDSRKEHPL